MPKDKFHVGQKVRLIKSDYRELIGQIVMITTARKAMNINGKIVFDYETDFVWNDNRMAGPENCFEAIYDGDEKVTWQSCEWKPNGIKE